MEYRPPRTTARSAGPARQPAPRSAPRGREFGSPTPARGDGGVRAAGQQRTRVSDARWQPPPQERPRPRPTRPAPPASRFRRDLLTSGKAALTILSVLVLVLTGYYWMEINKLTGGTQTANVIDGYAGEKPADGAVDILLVGLDSRTDAQGHPLSKEQLRMLTAGVSDGELNTDTLILMRIPNDGGKAVGISIPRDSYVDIPNGYGKHKINSAYARAKNDSMRRLRDQGVKDEAELEVRSNEDGARELIQTVQNLTGAHIDHYAQVNLLGFYDITNAVGGIDVCLNEAVNDSYSGAHFPAGHQTLAGAPALAFVRQRHGLPNGDLDRIVRQQTFMSGMTKKVLSKDMLTPGSDTLDKLAAAVQKSVVLDPGWNMIQFAQQMISYTGGNLSFQTVPTGSIALKTPSDGDAVEISPRDVQSFVKGTLGGQAASTPTQTAESNSGVTVDVRNATSRNGLAAQASGALTAKGFTAGTTGTVANRSTSSVRYAPGEQAHGQAVADALGIDSVQEDSSVSAGHVTVTLGKDFQLPADSGTTTQPKTSTPASAQKTQTPTGDGCVN